MKRINLAIAVMALCAPLSAQNINQSVQVTNDYVSRFSDFQKTTTGLQVPDSLYRFDYAFDYSVFETPYKGSYEFSPYRIAVTPEARLYDGSKFFLRAGAGYSIHPQFEMAWQMFQSQDFAIGVFAEAGGYAGKYSRRGVADPFSGHDLSGRVGLGGQYLRPATRLSYHFGYEGIFAGMDGADPYYRSGFSSVIAAGRIQSRERPGNQMFYDIDVQYRYSSDEGRVQGEARASGENNLRVALSAGPVLASKYRILVDGIFELELLRGEDFLSGSALHGEMFGGRRMACLGTIKPHVDFLLGPVRLDAGVRVDYTKGTEQGAFTVPARSCTSVQVCRDMCGPACSMKSRPAMSLTWACRSLRSTVWSRWTTIPLISRAASPGAAPGWNWTSRADTATSACTATPPPTPRPQPRASCAAVTTGTSASGWVSSWRRSPRACRWPETAYGCPGS